MLTRDKKASRVNKIKRQGKLNWYVTFDVVYQKLSKLVHAFQNYSLSKLARFVETPCILPTKEAVITFEVDVAVRY